MALEKRQLSPNLVDHVLEHKSILHDIIVDARVQKNLMQVRAKMQKATQRRTQPPRPKINRKKRPHVKASKSGGAGKQRI